LNPGHEFEPFDDFDKAPEHLAVIKNCTETTDPQVILRALFNLKEMVTKDENKDGPAFTLVIEQLPKIIELVTLSTNEEIRIQAYLFIEQLARTPPPTTRGEFTLPMNVTKSHGTLPGEEGLKAVLKDIETIKNSATEDDPKAIRVALNRLFSNIEREYHAFSFTVNNNGADGPLFKLVEAYVPKIIELAKSYKNPKDVKNAPHEKDVRDYAMVLLSRLAKYDNVHASNGVQEILLHAVSIIDSVEIDSVGRITAFPEADELNWALSRVAYNKVVPLVALALQSQDEKTRKYSIVRLDALGSVAVAGIIDALIPDNQIPTDQSVRQDSLNHAIAYLSKELGKGKLPASDVQPDNIPPIVKVLSDRADKLRILACASGKDLIDHNICHGAFEMLEKLASLNDVNALNAFADMIEAVIINPSNGTIESASSDTALNKALITLRSHLSADSKHPSPAISSKLSRNAQKLVALAAHFQERHLPVRKPAFDLLGLIILTNTDEDNKTMLSQLYQIGKHPDIYGEENSAVSKQVLENLERTGKTVLDFLRTLFAAPEEPLSPTSDEEIGQAS
jgi:hypothetical protein